MFRKSESNDVLAAQNNPLPGPTGTYKVGVEWRHWIDQSREETFGKEPHGKREMMVAFFYPADKATNGDTAPYLTHEDAVIPAFNQVLTVVGLALSLLPSDFKTFRSYSYPDAPLSDDQASYPVLVFSPGAGADLRMYTAQLEELASHGYIVVAINHAYGTSAIVFPDGQVVNADFSTGLDGAAAVWSQDQRFVMDQLETINKNDPNKRFTNHLDLAHLGVFGQSLGGAAATMTCFADKRCTAGVNGDGPVYGDVIKKGLDQPFLYLLSDSRIFSDPNFYAKGHGAFYEVAFKGFEHLDFSDMALWSHVEPFHEGKWLGSVEGNRAVELTRAYLVAFFDKYFKGENSKLLEGNSSDYVEVAINSSNVKSA